MLVLTLTEGSPHSVVVHAQSTADVVEVVKLANKHRVPIVAYSGGTSLEGNLSGVSVRPTPETH